MDQKDGFLLPVLFFLNYMNLLDYINLSDNDCWPAGFFDRFWRDFGGCLKKIYSEFFYF